MSAPVTTAPRLPASDVSPWVGLVGVATLFGWIAFARLWPEISTRFELPGPREVLSGPHSALAAMIVTGLTMAAWSLAVDKVHRNPSTGIDWRRKRPLASVIDVSITKLVGLWITWLAIAGAYCPGPRSWVGQ